MCIVAENFKLAERKHDHRHRVIKKGNYYSLELLFCYTREQEKESRLMLKKRHTYSQGIHTVVATSKENI